MGSVPYTYTREAGIVPQTVRSREGFMIIIKLIKALCDLVYVVQSLTKQEELDCDSNRSYFQRTRTE